MSEKLDEFKSEILAEREVFGGDMVSETEVKINLNNFTEVEGILDSINELKIKYPYTRFSVEVDMC